MTLIFETHATSLDNEAGVASGWFDVGLSATGEEQARLLGERRRGDAFAAVFCSDLSRSRRTAAIAFAGRAIPIIEDARLRECDYGDLERRPSREVEPRRVRQIAEPYPNGESYQQVVDRVLRFLLDAVDRYESGAILVVGHRATLYALEHLVSGVSLEVVMTSPWRWQPGWTYHVDHRLLSRRQARA